jgi:ATP-binding cassette subfamily F protein uup
MLDRVSTIVIGLDGGEGNAFADYSQWEAFRGEQLSEKPAPKLPRPATPTEEPKKKLSYLHQREWDGMEAKILEAEHELAACQRELQASASDPDRVTEAYDKMHAAQRRVEDLYARWAELESQLIPNP